MRARLRRFAEQSGPERAHCRACRTGMYLGDHAGSGLWVSSPPSSAPAAVKGGVIRQSILTLTSLPRMLKAKPREGRAVTGGTAHFFSFTQSSSMFSTNCVALFLTRFPARSPLT